jgi:hypothetical protein
MEVSFFIFQIFKNWWWFFFPLIFFPIARFFYFWWIRWEVYYKKTFKWILLEIKPPKEVLKPFSAMENIYSLIWGIFDDPNWRERWCAGEFPLGGGGWFSFEICSFGGEIHFFARIPDSFRIFFESAIHSQYPDAEITQVEDYTQKIPKDIPNEKWDLYSEDYVLLKEDYFPIKTYSMFFEKETEEKRVIEEKRLDPMDSLLESLATLQSGEQVWLQIVINPAIESQFPPFRWGTEGRKAADKIARRPSPKASKPLIQEALEILIGGPSKKEEARPMELIAPELRLTPVEKEVLKGIEDKIKKPACECWIKQVYICKKDEPHIYGNNKLVRGYLMAQFATEHMNRFIFFGGTRTRIHYWLKERRLFLRKRQRLREAIERLPSYFPWNMTGEPPPFIKFLTFFGYRILPGRRSTCILNIEELATIFHFPIKIYIPTVPRVEVKKVGPPPTLPGE